MKRAPRPTSPLSISEDGVIVKIVNDEREPFGSRKISFNEAGLDRFSHLVEEYACNSIEILYHGISKNKIVRHLDLRLDKIKSPGSITEIQIAEAGAFSPEFDFKFFDLFNNVKSFTIWSIPIGGKLEALFPKLEVLRILDWKKNKIKFDPNLWRNLRCLQISGFQGDLSIFGGWDIRSLFLDAASITPFSSIKALPQLETLRADNLKSEADLAALSDLRHLKNFSLKKPRRAPDTAGFASPSLEMMVLDKIDHIDLARDFPNLEVYGVDRGKAGRLDRWDAFDAYGDPFAAVHFVRYPFAD